MLNFKFHSVLSEQKTEINNKKDCKDTIKNDIIVNKRKNALYNLIKPNYLEKLDNKVMLWGKLISNGRTGVCQ